VNQNNDDDDGALMSRLFVSRRQRFARLAVGAVLSTCAAIGVLAVLAPARIDSPPTPRAVAAAPVAAPSEPASTAGSVFAPAPTAASKDAKTRGATKPSGRATGGRALGGR
jgi:hypothetical protein